MLHPLFSSEATLAAPMRGDQGPNACVHGCRGIGEWSRRAIGLKVFMSLAELGGIGLSELERARKKQAHA
jgi:hypothetical protein